MLRVDPSALRAVPADPQDEAAALRAALFDAQEALRESRRQFHHLVGNISGIVYRCTVGAPWRMSFVSQGVEALTGYGHDMLEQEKAWAEIMHPADVPAVEAEVAAAVAVRRSFSLCYRIVH
ncbi:MAG: hypothetical protein QOC65_103, partial [Sphingomonadales bacterium]|nr:hypothetical protein [Sphingomonadales bacterium]